MSRHPTDPANSYLCVDMHVHSEYSPDGSSKVRSIVSKARRLGIGVALTDHNRIEGNLEAQRLSEGSVPVVPAIEVTTADRKDLLVYFYSTRDLIRFYETSVESHRMPGMSSRTDLSLDDVIAAASRWDGLVGIPHPYALAYKNIVKYLERNGGMPFLKKAWAVEGINGSLGKISNQKAITLARDFNKPILGGSDAHSLGGVGNTLTCSRAADFRSLLDAIAAGDGFVLGRRNGMHPMLGPDGAPETAPAALAAAPGGHAHA